MGQSDPEYSEFGTVLADGGDRFAVSAICFDSQEELLWMGNEAVCVTFLFTLWQYNKNFVVGSCYVVLWFRNAKVYVFPSSCNGNGSPNLNDRHRDSGINAYVFETSNSSRYSEVYTSFWEYD